MKKSDVNGDNTNEVYKWLKNEKSGLLGLTRIKVLLYPSLNLRALVLNRMAWLLHSGTSRNSLSIRTETLCNDGLLQQRPKRLMSRLRRLFDSLDPSYELP